MNRPRSGFTLIELLTVIAVIAILAAILMPAISGVRERAMVAKSVSNLRYIGVAIQNYVADNDGFLPGGRTGPSNGIFSNRIAVREDRYAQWSEEVTPYVDADNPSPTITNVSAVFRDPIYEDIAGPIDNPSQNYRGGYAWNGRMGLSIGKAFGVWNPKSSRNSRSKAMLFPTNTIIVGPYYWECFHPENDGTVPNTGTQSRFSVTKTSAADHQRRIGSDENGQGGTSALYLFLDGSVRELEPGTSNSEDPDTAAYYLKLRNI